MTDNGNDKSASPPVYRMVAIDLDGTLLSPAGSVSERTVAAVRAALSAEILVCFATGRNWTESKLVLDAVAHYDTAVFVGGAMVVDTKRRVTLHRTMMQPGLARELSAFFEQSGHAVLALQDTGTAGVDYLISAAHAIDSATELWMTLTSAVVQRISNLADHPHDHTIRVGIVCPSDGAAAVVDELAARFGGRIVCHSISVGALGVNVIECFDPAVNKWEGILHVARAHGVDPAAIIAVGDDVNDLPMIRQAGLGVAMGNAKPEVKAAAKRVIGSNADDGLAVFLEELVTGLRVGPA